MSIEVEAARAGARVLWIAQRMEDVRAALNTHANIYPAEVRRLTRANGDERITYESGGKIRYVSVRGHGGRGYTADVLSVTHMDYTNPDLMGKLLPCLATSPNACIIIRTESDDA